LDTTKKRFVDEIPNKMVEMATAQTFSRIHKATEDPHFIGRIDHDYTNFNDMAFVESILNPATKANTIQKFFNDFHSIMKNKFLAKMLPFQTNSLTPLRPS
jgi:hypothetical protein